jgi:membrane protein DedA with SNARE-associated domain
MKNFMLTLSSFGTFAVGYFIVMNVQRNMGYSQLLLLAILCILFTLCVLGVLLNTKGYRESIF